MAKSPSPTPDATGKQRKDTITQLAQMDVALQSTEVSSPTKKQAKDADPDDPNQTHADAASIMREQQSNNRATKTPEVPDSSSSSTDSATPVGPVRKNKLTAKPVLTQTPVKNRTSTNPNASFASPAVATPSMSDFSPASGLKNRQRLFAAPSNLPGFGDRLAGHPPGAILGAWDPGNTPDKYKEAEFASFNQSPSSPNRPNRSSRGHVRDAGSAADKPAAKPGSSSSAQSHKKSSVEEVKAKKTHDSASPTTRAIRPTAARTERTPTTKPKEAEASTAREESVQPVPTTISRTRARSPTPWAGTHDEEVKAKKPRISAKNTITDKKHNLRGQK